MNFDDLPEKYPDTKCNHGVIFDKEKAKGLTPAEIQKKYPRGCFTEEKPCKCGFTGIAYASLAHYLYGDW